MWEEQSVKFRAQPAKKGTGGTSSAVTLERTSQSTSSVQPPAAPSSPATIRPTKSRLTISQTSTVTDATNTTEGAVSSTLQAQSHTPVEDAPKTTEENRPSKRLRRESDSDTDDSPVASAAAGDTEPAKSDAERTAKRRVALLALTPIKKQLDRGDADSDTSSPGTPTAASPVSPDLLSPPVKEYVSLALFLLLQTNVQLF